MNSETIRTLEERSYNDTVTKENALSLLHADSSLIFDLIASSSRIRRKYKGDTISLCSIINAKSGRCGEDCAFCSQSVHNNTGVVEYPLVEKSTFVKSFNEAVKQQAHKFGIVTSGKSVNKKKEFEEILSVVSEFKKKMHCCASLGVIDTKTVRILKQAGLKEYHHNLETARSFFPSICSTHEYDENVNTVKAVKEAGLRVCCGGIFGMGETLKQRVELAFELKELDVDSIPINFLNPIAGTKLEATPLLKPMEVLKIIAMFRFVHPKKDIKVAGGREVVLRDLQSFIFAAGANSTMVGNYLTTKGRDFKDDHQMIKDLELDICAH